MVLGWFGSGLEWEEAFIITTYHVLRVSFLCITSIVSLCYVQSRKYGQYSYCTDLSLHLDPTELVS